MHAIVLVGGFGTRLRPLTNTLPKSMLTIGNEPIIDPSRRAPRAPTASPPSRCRWGSSRTRSSTPSPTAAAVGCALRYAVEPEPLDTAGAIRFAAAEPASTTRSSSSTVT